MAGRPLRHARHNGKSKWSFVANLPLNLSHFFDTDIISDNLDAKDVYRKLKAGTEVEWLDKETGVQYALSPLNETTVILLERKQERVISSSARRNSSGHNSPSQKYMQTDVTLTAHQVLNLSLMVRQHQAEMQYLDLTAQQKSLISSWLDQILSAVLSPHTLD